MNQVRISPFDPRRLREALSEDQAAELDRTIEHGQRTLEGRVVWNVNSTAYGGGVAEMLHSLIAYARGGGVDARWNVIEGNPDFFAVTKRIHNMLHGSPGDGGSLGDAERAVYEGVAEANARDLAELVCDGDIVLLHDPQTAGLVQPLLDMGAHVVWRCHVGLDVPNELARSAWRFLLPYVAPAESYVFSRHAFAWEDLDSDRLVIIPPSIDAFSPKNQDIGPAEVEAILHAAGLEENGATGHPVFMHGDGSPGRVDRDARVVRSAPLRAGVPLVVQVSRWDRLKDPLGVMEGFADRVAPHSDAHLMLAGPDVLAVTDDPEGGQVFQECSDRWEELAPEVQERVHLALLPMDDAEENAATVNALQRRADVIVQKSIAEGFGLTVSEAMWKARPVVASRVGGIQDQIVDGVSGMLVDPLDLNAYGDAVAQLVRDPEAAARIGRDAMERVREQYLGARHLMQYVVLFESLIGARAT
jgi:trehalose synthase